MFIIENIISLCLVIVFINLLMEIYACKLLIMINKMVKKEQILFNK